MLADSLTKALLRQKHKAFVRQLQLVDITTLLSILTWSYRPHYLFTDHLQTILRFNGQKNVRKALINISLTSILLRGVCYMTRHMNQQHQNNSNHSSFHSIATTPYLRPLLQSVLRLLWLELLLERWMQGYVALPQKSVLYSKFCIEFSMSLSIYRRVLSIGTSSWIHSLSPSHSPMRQNETQVRAFVQSEFSNYRLRGKIV